VLVRRVERAPVAAIALEVQSLLEEPAAMVARQAAAEPSPRAEPLAKVA
jgi:hypothetical protein